MRRHANGMFARKRIDVRGRYRDRFLLCVYLLIAVKNLPMLNENTISRATGKPEKKSIISLGERRPFSFSPPLLFSLLITPNLRPR